MSQAAPVARGPSLSWFPHPTHHRDWGTRQGGRFGFLAGRHTPVPHLSSRSTRTGGGLIVVQPHVRLSRTHIKPTPYTFQARQVREAVLHHVQDGKGWADPCAGKFTVPEFTNDLDPGSPAQTHTEAVEWLRSFDDASLLGVVIDPPFSPTQKKRAYQRLGAPLSKQACDSSWWASLKDEAARIIRPGGKAVCCGWNSNGLSRGRGFRLDEVHLFASGGMHNDLIVSVETKVNGRLVA